MKFLNKKISPVYSLVILFLSSLFFYYGLTLRDSHAEMKVATFSHPVITNTTVTHYRMNNYQYTHPLLLSDMANESDDLLNLKNEIAAIIDSKKGDGEITASSVFLTRLNDGHWMNLNGGEQFHPGSLIKVPIMMTYLREAEKNPGLLDRKLSIPPNTKVPSQTFNDKTIIPGKSYTVRELLYFMIAQSDNNATLLINQNVNVDEFKHLFTSAGIAEPDVHSSDYNITAAEYSKFLCILYNASYLNNEDADFALSLLAQSSFKDGIMSGLPQGMKVCHKFGEWGQPVAGSLHELHESGIIYFDSNPVLVTIMTKGREVKPLPGVISDITKLVYSRMSPAGIVKS
jgi:beta-lactamase class A